MSSSAVACASSFLDGLCDPACVLDLAGHVLLANAEARAVLTPGDSALIQAPFWALACGPARQDALRQAFEARATRVEADLPGAPERWFAWTFRVIPDTTQVLCSGVEVSQRRILEVELAAAREKLLALVEHSPDYVAFHDVDLRYTWVSRVEPPATPDMLIGMCDADFIPPEEVGPLAASRRRVMETGVPERNEMGMMSRGVYRRFHSVITRRLDAQGRLLGTAAYTRDITDRWLAEQELRKVNESLERRVAERTAAIERQAAELRENERRARESQERYRLLFEQSPMSTQVITPDGRVLRANRAWEKLWGVTLEMVQGFDVMADPQLVANGVVAQLKRAFAGETVRMAPSAFVPAMGEYAGATRWVRAVAYPAAVRDGVADEIVVIQEDVTEPIIAQEALRLRTALLEAVGEAAIDGVLAVSAAGRVVWSNRRFAQMWNISDSVMAEGIDAAALIVVMPQLQDPQAFASRVAQWYDHPTEQGWDEVPLKDGRVFERYTAPMDAAAGEAQGRVWFFRDVTERKIAEENLRQSDRHHRELAERNRWLAREVEHRVGNHLAGLVGLISMMRQRSPDVDSFADAIESRLRGMAEVHRMLTAGGRHPVSLRTLVRTALDASRCMTAHEPTEIVDGPDVTVSAKQAVPLMMTLVELYTNSCKYGAHTVVGGSLRVAWSVTDAERGQRVRLRWRERGVPIARGPVRRSIGMQLVKELAARELGGTCRLTLRPDGADHLLDFPIQ